MAFGIPYTAFVLDQLFDGSDGPQSCRAACAPRKSHSPRHHHHHHGPRFSPQHHQAELRDLEDSYVLFQDLPGFSREEVTVKVEDGHLVIVAAAKATAADSAEPLKVLLAERQRRAAVSRRWKLADDALLDGIHAQLRNGELVVIIPKRTHNVPQHFDVPILGADEAPADNQPALAAAPVAPALPAVTATPPAEVPAAQPPVAEAPAAPVTAAAAAPDVPMTESKESDGSWSDVSEEEETEAKIIRRKGKMPMEGPVLEEIQRQEAERLAAMQHAEDSD